MCVVHLPKTSVQNKFCCDECLKKSFGNETRNVGKTAYIYMLIIDI